MIKEIWLVSRDGILLHHGIIKKSIPIDPDLIGALMSAIQSFSEELTGKNINYLDIAGDERLIYIPLLHNHYFLVARSEFYSGERVFNSEVEKFRFIVGSAFSHYEDKRIAEQNFEDINLHLQKLYEPFNQILEMLRDFYLREEERLGQVNIDVTKNLDFFQSLGNFIAKTKYNLFILDRKANIILFQRMDPTMAFSDHSFLLRILNEIKFSLLIKENLNRVAFTNGIIEVLAQFTEHFIYILINSDCDNLNLTNPTNFVEMSRIMIEIVNSDTEYFIKLKKRINDI
ncbi:MAG: hypothetical protein ACTSQE_08985 [Candidatus Heimdallarchaeaceae archaeon]